MRSAWFNCHAGVAGDMTLAALIDAGADRAEVANTIAGLGVDGYALFFERVQRCGVGATWANVVTHAGLHEHADDNEPTGLHDLRGHDTDVHAGAEQTPSEHGADGHTPVAHVHRPAREIFALLEQADVADRVRRRALAVFTRLATVEGAIHGIDAADVELHEVGALDSIIDVVGVCAALESLGIDEIRCSSIGLGSGLVSTAHGVLPHPAPATIALLAQSGAPTHGLPTSLETATPTGAALMTTLATHFGPIGRGTPTSIGYGAGTADTPGRANVVQVVISDRDDAVHDRSLDTPSDVFGTPGTSLPTDGAAVALLESNLDDVTGEVLADTVAVLVDAGAHDAWLTPIVMKKGRPAHTIHVLCDPARTAEFRDLLVAHTGTLGVRASTMVRWPQQRRMSSVDIDGHAIGVKISEHRVKVEFDDAARAASALGVPTRVVIERAVAAAEAWSPPDAVR